MAPRPPSANTPDSSEPTAPQGDPWSAFGYLVAGVLVYGLVGWGLDRWLGTRFLVAVGIVVGAVFGVYMTWARFRIPPTGPSDKKTS